MRGCGGREGGKGKGIGVSGDRNPFARAASGFVRSRADSNPLSTPAMLSCSAWVSLSLWLSFASEAKAESARGRRDAVTDGAVGGCGRWGHVIASCGRRSVAGCHVHYGWAPTPARHHYAHTPAINRFITLQAGRGRADSNGLAHHGGRAAEESGARGKCNAIARKDKARR